MFLQDYVMNGRGFGEVGSQLAGCHFEPGLLRPYIDQNGQRCVTVRNSRGIYEKRTVAEMIANGIQSPVFNATSLRKDEWVRLDTVVLKSALQRLRAWTDLASANTYGGFNGMSKTILEHETMSDPGEAVVDMDGLSEGRNDAPRFQLEGLPLPITHCDFFFSSRYLAQSQNTGQPIDTTMAEAAGRRVAEMVERTLIGTETGLTFGTTANYGRAPTVYGYTNFPSRNTKTDLTTPTGANPEAVLQDILEMRDQMYADNYFGPFVLYHSTNYDAYLDNDYFRSGGTSETRTLRERIMAVDGISAIRRLDYLTSGFQLIMVQMTADVARAVVGMDITTVQWQTIGGMRENFKVMCILVPQLRADYSGRCGILHATTS